MIPAPATRSEPRFEDRVLFSTNLVRIGAFRCDRGHLAFPASRPIENDCFWFARTPVMIEPERGGRFLANPNVATFYNRTLTYRRHGVAEHGDFSDWFGVDSDLLRDALQERFPSCEDEAPRFPASHGFVDAGTYLMQRRLFELVSGNGSCEPIEVEERVVRLLERVLDGVALSMVPVVKAPLPQHRRLAADAELLLSTLPLDARLSLTTIAAHVGASAFHLCRAFRRVTGVTLHQYRTSLRLRASLERVAASSETLTSVALGLGFNSHSHFTAAFRREFGEHPSAFRAACARRRRPARA